ncbi:PIF1, partial [Symbiodinium necroappetens]
MASSRWSSPAAASAVADELLDLGILEDDAVAVDSLDRAELALWPEPDMSHASEEALPDDLEIELGRLVEEAMEAMSDASVSDEEVEAPPAENPTPPMPAPSSSPVSSAVTQLLRKQPAARKSRPNELDSEAHLAAFIARGQASRRASIRTVATYVVFFDKGDGLYDAALGRLRQHLGEAKVASLIDPWQVRLQQRRSDSAPLKRKPRDAYEVQVKRDRRVARRKVFFPDKLHSRAAEADEAAEIEHVRATGMVQDLAAHDTGLPKPKESTPRFVEDWCKQGSWGICEKCHSLCPKSLQPVDVELALESRTFAPKLPEVTQQNQARELVVLSEDCHRLLQGSVQQASWPVGRAKRIRDLMLSCCRNTHLLGLIVPGLRRWPIECQNSLRGLGSRLRALRSDRCRWKAASSSLREILLGFLLEGTHLLQDHLLMLLANMVDDLTRPSQQTSAPRVRRWSMCHNQHADIPEPLRDLKPRVIEALRPLEIDTGAAERVRVHTAMISFAWEPVSVEYKITSLEKRKDFVVKHNEFLEKHGENADKKGRKRRAEDSSDEEAAEDAPDGEVLSPVIGYGADYQLLHFVYDLSMVDRRGHRSTGELALIDMQRQCGNASLFRTRAPYERTFPYHRWILHEQEVLGRPRQHLAGAETLHTAHVLLQLDKGYFCGAMARAGRADRNWKEHLLGPAAGDGTSTVVAHATRLEFQDGKRKRGTQKYHGRGTTHSHSLDFLENIESIGLDSKVQATIPPKDTEPLLHGLVTDSQCDYKDSGLPVREEPSAWDPDGQKVLLHHTEDDKDAKVRAYFKDTMEVTKCHEDVQQGDGNGAVLRYVSTYNMKFSNSMDSDWLNGAASDYSTAAGVLRRYQPREPEMWLTLAQERFPQAYLSGTFVDYMAPSFLDHDDTTVVTCTRQGAATINDLAATVFFEDRHKQPLGVLPPDYEANQDNYGRGGRLRSGTLQPALRKIYKGMRIFLTKNMSKEDDFVNGMAAKIEDYDERSRCLQVLTRTHQRLAVYMVTHELEDGRKVAAFPVRLDYASTVPKVQGMTLPHVTLWLDHAACRAAAYVAMSRVQKDEDYLIAGLVMQHQAFRPCPLTGLDP